MYDLVLEAVCYFVTVARLFRSQVCTSYKDWKCCIYNRALILYCLYPPVDSFVFWDLFFSREVNEWKYGC